MIQFSVWFVQKKNDTVRSLPGLQRQLLQARSLAHKNVYRGNWNSNEGVISSLCSVQIVPGGYKVRTLGHYFQEPARMAAPSVLCLDYKISAGSAPNRQHWQL